MSSTEYVRIAKGGKQRQEYDEKDLVFMPSRRSSAAAAAAAMRGSELLFLAAAALVLADDFGGRGRESFLSETHERGRGNVTLRVGAIFTKEDIESGANLVFQVKSHLDFHQHRDSSVRLICG